MIGSPRVVESRNESDPQIDCPQVRAAKVEGRKFTTSLVVISLIYLKFILSFTQGYKKQTEGGFKMPKILGPGR